MEKNSKSQPDLSKRLTREQLVEVLRVQEADPLNQRAKALAEKIDNGTSTQEERDEFEDLCPPVPPGFMGDLSHKQIERISREYLAQKRKERAEKEATQSPPTPGL